jgi:DNA-directed RNA polymerase specialized sigma24 family protein
MLSEIEREAEAQQARTGQPLDTAALYKDVSRVLYSIPQRRFGFSAEESAELVQEAWCLFMQKQETIQMAKPWVAGTVVNLCKQQIHTLTRRRETPRQMSSETVEIAGAHCASYDKTLMIRQALEQLDERGRQLCVLIGMEGWSKKYMGWG